jgi:hypothetical protein
VQKIHNSHARLSVHRYRRAGLHSFHSELFLGGAENSVLRIAHIDSLCERSLVCGDNVESWPIFLDGSAVHPNHSFTQGPDLAHLVAYEDDGAASLGHFTHFLEALLLKLQIADGQDLIDEENFWLKGEPRRQRRGVRTFP